MPKQRNNSTSQRARTRLGRWQDRFIASLSRMGNVSRAIKASGAGRQTVYDHRLNDPKFAARWADALDQAADRLEREAWRRAVKGVDRPVFQGGGRVGTVREYSDTLLIQLLKACKPEKFRENATIEHTGKGGAAIKTTHKVDLSDFTDEELLRFERAFARSTGGVGAAGRN